MKSKTKFELDNKTIIKIFEFHKICGVEKIYPLSEGQYNAVYSVSTKKEDYVLKVAPISEENSLIYEKNIMQTEIFWYQQMKEKTTIKIPEIYCVDFSKSLIPADFFIMEKVKGVQMNKFDFIGNEKEEAAGIMAKFVAQIHSIANNKYGYIQNELYDDWYQAIRAMTQNLIDDCHKKGRKTKRAQKLLNYIDKYKEILQKPESCMVNFDLWYANIMCERVNGEVVYSWIDPERGFWGDRIADFVCLEFMKPLQDKKLSIAAYNAVAKNPITVSYEENIRFAIATAYLGVIVEVEKYYRYSPITYGWWMNVFAAKMYYSMAFKVLKNGKDSK